MDDDYLHFMVHFCFHIFNLNFYQMNSTIKMKRATLFGKAFICLLDVCIDEGENYQMPEHIHDQILVKMGLGKVRAVS